MRKRGFLLGYREDECIYQYVDLDRKGTKAAAVTMAFLTLGCALVMERSENVRLDRPFLYAIMHNESGLPVFTGIMNKAQK